MQSVTPETFHKYVFGNRKDTEQSSKSETTFKFVFRTTALTVHSRVSDECYFSNQQRDKKNHVDFFYNHISEIKK